MTQPVGLNALKLVTVNKFPERAKTVIGRLVTELRDRYTIIHAGNVDKIEGVAATVKDIKPDLLFCASMWTPEESQQLQTIARAEKPGIKTMVIPQGLQAEKGLEGVVEFLVEHVPNLIDGK